MALPEPLTRLIDELQRLPGVGPKSAQRLAFHVLKAPAHQAEALAEALRDEKVKVLRAVRLMGAEQAQQQVVRGQYGPGWIGATEVAGYRGEPAVDPASETETFVAARFEIDDWRWAGVPFYLRAGKRLPKRATEIAIQFKDVPQRLFSQTGDAPESNMLVIRIQPDEGILLRFAAKVPGLGTDVRPVNMDFAYGSAFSVDSPDAYETLILDALLGDASLFTRASIASRRSRRRPFTRSRFGSNLSSRGRLMPGR